MGILGPTSVGLGIFCKKMSGDVNVREFMGKWEF